MMKLKLVKTKNGIFTEVRVKIAQKLECFVKKHKCVKVKVSSSYAYYAFEGNLFED